MVSIAAAPPGLDPELAGTTEAEGGYHHLVILLTFSIACSFTLSLTLTFYSLTQQLHARTTSRKSRNS
jgi:hypothetical protein